MGETKEQISYIGSIQESMDKIAAGASENALNFVIDFIKDKYGKASISTGNAFKLYLKNSELRYNKIKTLADLSEPRELEGHKGIYVDVFVKYKERKIPVSTIDSLTQVSNNIIIVGSGGSGKSMIMRHLFLNTHHRGELIPILVQLRQISDKDDKNALLNLIHSSIESFDLKLDHSQLEYSLRTGKYLILLDGLDEVKEEIRRKTELLIQKLSEKYPKNKYVVSSRREGVNFSELVTYTLMKVCPLEKEQAINLAKKLGQRNEKTDEFSKLLDIELYDKHIDFASNPLLLTMMYITFIDNNMIPEHLTDFYDNAYDALYKRHDANKDGLFNRDYKCTMLGEKEFKDLFSYFCFQTYFRQQYEFSKDEICLYIQKGIERLSLQNLINKAENFFDDIKDIVCLIVDDGNKYKYAHRSFQTYFAAYYTSVHVADNQQKQFLKQEISREYSAREDFFSMLYRLEGERFISNILEPGIKDVLNIIENEESDSFALLKIYCQSISVHDGRVVRGLNSSNYLKIPYERNIVMMFENLILKEGFFSIEIGNKIIEKMEHVKRDGDFIEIEITDLLSIEPDDLKNELIDLIYQYYGTKSLLKSIKNWYTEQNKKRERMEKEQDSDEMLVFL